MLSLWIAAGVSGDVCKGSGEMGVSVDGGQNDNISISMPLLLVDSSELTDGELHIHAVCVVAECRC